MASKKVADATANPQAAPMPQFRYRAVTVAGEIVVGEVDAPSREEVVRRIEYLGHLAIDAEIATTGILTRSLGKLPRSRDVSIFLRQLALLIGAGLTLEAALQTLGDDASKGLAGFANGLRASISVGESFADALEHHSSIIDPTYVAMVRVGEASAPPWRSYTARPPVPSEVTEVSGRRRRPYSVAASRSHARDMMLAHIDHHCAAVFAVKEVDE
jgi:hypothetical protein